MKKKKHHLLGKFNEIKHSHSPIKRVSMAIQWNSRLGKNEYKHRKLMWGKYTGYFIKDLPNDYLKWAILNTNMGEWTDWLAREYNSRSAANII